MGVKQYSLRVLHCMRDPNLVCILKKNKGKRILVFCDTNERCLLLELMLMDLKLNAIRVFGAKDRDRLHNLQNGTTVISTVNLIKEIKIPAFDVVVNYDLPRSRQDYQARLRRIPNGEAVTLILSDDDDPIVSMRFVMKLPCYNVDDAKAQRCVKRVEEAFFNAKKSIEEAKTFESLGLCRKLTRRCVELGWRFPSKIQVKSIPLALEGKDVIGVAKKGSGKTGAFALPILHRFLQEPEAFFACVLSPTQDLAKQVAGQFQNLGYGEGITCSMVPEGDLEAFIASTPHIIVSTPRCLLELLKDERFSCNSVKYWVLDDLDLLLQEDLTEISKVMHALPKERHIYAYSATKVQTRPSYLTDPEEVHVLRNMQLRHPVKIDSFLDTLNQQFRFIPRKYKEAYLVHHLMIMQWRKAIIFCMDPRDTHVIATMLKRTKFHWVKPYRGQFLDVKKKELLEKFEMQMYAILVWSMDARLPNDISMVDFVVNFDIPDDFEEYHHRVSVTKQSGLVVSLVDEDSVDKYLEIQDSIGRNLQECSADLDEVHSLSENVMEANKATKKTFEDGKPRKQ